MGRCRSGPHVKVFQVSRLTRHLPAHQGLKGSMQWCVLGQSTADRENASDFAYFGKPTSSLFANPEVGS
jgi:hypothetical protein